MESSVVLAVQGTAKYPKPQASKPAAPAPNPPKKRVVFQVGPKNEPAERSLLSRLLFGGQIETGLVGCTTLKGTIVTDLAEEDGIVLNPEGERVTFADLEPSTENTRKAVIYINNLPKIILTGKGVQNAQLYIEIGTDSELLGVNEEDCPCIEGMFDPYQPDQETALPVTVLKIEVVNNRADQSETEDEVQDLGSYCEVAEETLAPASADVPSEYHSVDGILDFSLRLELEVDLSNWTGSENVQSLIYVRLKKG